MSKDKDSRPALIPSSSTNEPIKILTEEAYRTWVHEQIANKLWKSLLTTFGIIGISGFAIFFHFLSYPVDKSVRDQLATQKIAQSAEIRDGIRASLSETLLNNV